MCVIFTKIASVKNNVHKKHVFINFFLIYSFFSFSVNTINRKGILICTVKLTFFKITHVKKS